MTQKGKMILKGRRGARAIALKILYAIDISQADPEEAIKLFYKSFLPKDYSFDQWDRPFMEFLVRGVCKHKQELDSTIEKASDNWRLYRMAVVDRNILRMSIFEMFYCKEIPPKVSINEAIELGKIFGDTESSSFINGVLDKVYQTLSTES